MVRELNSKCNREDAKNAKKKFGLCIYFALFASSRLHYLERRRPPLACGFAVSGSSGHECFG
jgi:hypothetical protein